MLATTISSSSTPACSACIHRLLRLGLASVTSPGHGQTRGKKKSVKPRTTIPVRLIRDVRGYGPKGSIVPIQMGPMRNYFYPGRLADYIPFPEKRELLRSGVVPQRNYSFGKPVAEEGAEVADVEAKLLDEPAQPTGYRKPVRVTLDMMQPSEAFEALSRLLPPILTFYRTPITPAPTSRMDADPAAAQVALQSAGLYPARSLPIYGSVSTGDVATSIKALVADSDVAGRLLINDEDIEFINATVQGADEQRGDANRIKHLGEFEIDVKIKGHTAAVRRQVTVLREDEAPVGADEAREAVKDLAGVQPVKGEVDEAVLSLEAKIGEAEKSVTELDEAAKALMLEGRIAQPPVELTPAEKAEIEEQGETVVEEKREDMARRRVAGSVKRGP